MDIRITGSGCYIPKRTVTNLDFAKHIFLDENGTPLRQPNDVIAEKFRAITGIDERRYAEENLENSDIAYMAAQKAIDDSGVDPETLDYIIMAHNFGNVKHGMVQSDMVPSLGTRVKHKLKIKNPRCVAYDILFGCPGWLEGVIQAQAFIKAGMAKKCLVIGAETLSRVTDPHDRDSMIYSDGAGATVIEATGNGGGILSHLTATYSYDEAFYLHFGKSFNKDLNDDTRYIKMHGRKIYEFALTNVPQAMKECLDKSGRDISEVKKVLMHQANEKMDEAIIQRFYKLYNQAPPKDVMPMCIGKLGNSSVATIPTLYDLMAKGRLENQKFHKGDVLIFASVGSGMNINAFVYEV